MMDLKEIIKWFIPCFHVLLLKKVKMCKFFYVFHLFLLFFVRPSCSAIVNSINEADTKNVVSFNSLDSNISQSDYYEVGKNEQLIEEEGLEMDTSMDTSVGRTFGRPFKKMVQALIPLAFQLGASTTWMAVAAIIGFKTLLVSLAILKILLLAGALKIIQVIHFHLQQHVAKTGQNIGQTVHHIQHAVPTIGPTLHSQPWTSTEEHTTNTYDVGALFAQKSHGHDQGWQAPHQKEVHVHIHGQHGHHEEISPAWSRDGATDASTNTNANNYIINPYAAPIAGPPTISTPYGNYVRLDSLQNNNQILSNLNT